MKKIKYAPAIVSFSYPVLDSNRNVSYLSVSFGQRSGQGIDEKTLELHKQLVGAMDNIEKFIEICHENSLMVTRNMPRRSE